jgi:hypothetical protein
VIFAVLQNQMNRKLLIAIVFVGAMATSILGQSTLNVEVSGDGCTRIYSNGAPAQVEGLSLRFSLNDSSFRSGDEFVASCVVSNYSEKPIMLYNVKFDDECTFRNHDGSTGVSRDRFPPSPRPPLIKLPGGESFTITNTYQVPEGYDYARWIENERELVDCRSEMSTRLLLSNVTPREISRVIDMAYPTNRPAVIT